MKNFTHALFLAIGLWLAVPFTAPGQTANVTIIGPTTLCQGQCAFYHAVPAAGQITQYIWQVTGAPSYNTPQIEVCANTANPITITIAGVTSQNIPFFDTLHIDVVTALNPSIISTTALCPDTTTSCDRVCAFTTATYELAGVSPSLPVEWEVIGAESFEPDGNTLTVEWGAAGQGLIKANVSNGGGDPLPIQLFCGQASIETGQPGSIPTGTGYIRLFNAPLPVIATLNGPTGTTTSATVTSEHFTFSGLGPGTYTVIITDLNGSVIATCSFVIAVTDSDCWTTVFPVELGHASNCTTCDGFIQVQAAGGVQLSYTYLWSTGSPGTSLTNLCPGSYSVTVADAQQCTHTATIVLACGSSCEGTATLCVEILEEPKAAIGSLPPAAGGVITICQGQTVYFSNESQNASSYAWDFGDLNTSAQFAPSHTYQVPGTYTVSLIARNACFCSDTTYVTVEVLAADVPGINCTGTVCEGETVTYTTDANCSIFNWNITGGGSILDGGGPGDNFITVQWMTGPEGTISLDVGGCAGNICNIANIVPIPIISDNVKIQGPDKVCEGSVEEYFIPDFAGTEIIWTVLGSGDITSGQGTDRITVNWYGNANIGNPQQVIVEFFNCYLGCGGRDTLLVSIVPGFYVTGPIEVCESTSGTYQSRNTITGGLMNSNWQLFNAAGTVVWASAGATNTANIPFNLPPGSYTVRATAASATGFCNNTYDIFVKLVAAPPAPTAITGPDEICPGTPYAYTAVGLPNTTFSWTVTGGQPASFFGNPVSVTWNPAPPYSLSVVQTAKTGLACTSQPFNMTVGVLPDFTLNGDAQVCRETTGAYAAPFFENIEYQWVTIPSDAGTVVSGAGTHSVEIRWHRDGPATVQATVCGITKTFPVTVLPLPEPIVPNATYCEGGSAIVTTTAPFSFYAWKNDAGTVVSTLINPGLTQGNYQVIVTDDNGCTGSDLFTVRENPSPTAKISTPSYFALCSGGPPAVIYAINAATSYDYEWMLDGSPIGGNTATYSTNTPGTYRVLVTNQYGCSALSNPLTLVDCEAIGGTCIAGICYGTPGGPPAPGGACIAAGTVNFNPAVTNDCNTIDFVNTSVNFIPGSFSWNFGDPASGANNFSNLQDPSHTFTGPGFYTVLMIGQVVALSPPGDVCALGIYKDVLVPLVPNFRFEEACANAPTAFTDRSEFIAGIGNAVAWLWDFGDPGSGAANTSTLQDPAHTFALPGDYTVTLTVTDVSGCQSSVSKTVKVHDPPPVNFNLPTFTCENTALLFDAIVPTYTANLAWDFGNPASGAANTAITPDAFHSYFPAGNYNVTLEATTIFGCTDSHTKTIGITPNTLAGDIAFNPPSPICEGESTVLTSPPGGIAWQWSTAAPTESITVSQSGVYLVTMTDATGCSYTPPLALVQVFGEPNGIIKAVIYNEYGQPVAFFENNYNVCEGEDVNLVIQGSLNYSFVWSNGEPGNEISFTEEKDNQLPVGTHVFTVTVTDNATGCTSMEGPFTVTVNPKPSVQIESVPSGFLCENTTANLNVVGPDPLLMYQWNTGETGTGITVVAGGTYFVQATNQFGCRSRSNEIILQNAPDINKVPNGCHNRCDPDTMCLPPLPVVLSYQWYLDGSPLSGPNGTQANPILDQSGVYHVVMTDIYGCTSTSSPLTLDLFPGFGNVVGNVWFDVNQNGIIDGPDTLVSGIVIFLNDGTTNLDAAMSGAGGNYAFVNISAENYLLLLDTTNLPPGWQAYLSSVTFNISGCGSVQQFDWLLFLNCVPETANVNLSACPGDSAVYNGTLLPAGAVQDFIFTAADGCDSIVTVAVAALTTSTLVVDAVACEGDFFVFNGVPILAGTGAVFTEINADGCLDTVIVGVAALPVNTSGLNLTACGNTPVIYEGQTLLPGDVQDFVFQNQFGCDSTVTVTVVSASLDTVALNLLLCEGETVTFNGQQLSVGDAQDFVFQNQSGCDSVVQVNVAGYPPVSFDLTADVVCWNGGDGSIEVLNISGGTLPYLFSIDGSTYQPDPLFGSLGPGTYTVTLQDGNDCHFEKTTTVQAIPPIVLETQNTTLACGDSVQLAPVAVSQLPLVWAWPDGSVAPNFWATSPGTYTFSVTNSCETVQRAVEVTAEPIGEGNLIYMPNSFSPNGDGINDCYRGYVSPRIQLQFFVLKIFDRWGNMVFETNDPEACWDGRFKGKEMDPAVFAWFLEIQALGCGGEATGVFLEGGVHLMR